MIDEKDIIKLDFIIEKIFNVDYYVDEDCIVGADFLLGLSLREVGYEFIRLLRIIEQYECADVNISTNSYRVRRNHTTVKFKEMGGFKKLYQDELTRLEKEEERDDLSMKKLKLDTKLSKWQVKTFWPVFVFGLIGFIFGVFNFVDNRNKTKSIQELQQDNRNIQAEVSRLHTLVLNQKTVGSLHNSRTRIDSLKQR